MRGYPPFLVSLLCTSPFLLCCTLSGAPLILEFETTHQNISENAFELKAGDSQISAKEGELWQAGVYPNPNLSVYIDDCGRNDAGSQNQLYIIASQTLELGGKRKARIRVADASRQVAKSHQEVTKMELHYRVLNAFIDLAVSQERLDIAKELETIAKESRDCVLANCSAGKISDVERRKSEVEYKTAQLAYLRHKHTFIQNKKKLLALWNETTPPDFDSVEFPLYELTEPPSYDELAKLISNNPELIESCANIVRSKEVVDFERAKRIPDLALQAGLTTNRFIEQPALILGFLVDLPIFDRNSGNISRAKHEYNQASYNYQKTEYSLEAKLSLVVDEWLGAYEQAVTLRDTVMALAEETYRLAQESYKDGKYDYINMLDAREKLFLIKQQFVDLAGDYQHKRAEVLKITGEYNEI